MANPKGFENCVSRPLSALDQSEFERFILSGQPHEGRGRRGVSAAHCPDEVVEASDEEIRLHGPASRSGAPIEEVPAPIADAEPFVSILETGDFRPLQFVAGTEALKDGAPRRTPPLPAVKVVRRGYPLLFRGYYHD